MKFAIVPLLLALATAKPVEPPQAVRVGAGEKILEITWDSVPGASGYNVYTAPAPGLAKKKRRQVNASLVTSGTRYTYIWHYENGEKVRAVKGRRHFISVTAVCSTKTGVVESPFSREADNLYFTGHGPMTSAPAIRAVLADSQKTPRLPVEWKPCGASAFISFMEGPGARLTRMLGDSINALETGACSPVSSLVVRLLADAGIDAYKAEGTFIREYHAFVLVNIEGVEYVLDFTANQFIPDVAPALLPRDRCFIGEECRFAEAGVPVYQIGRLFTPDQSQLLVNSETAVYRAIYDAVKKTIAD